MLYQLSKDFQAKLKAEHSTKVFGFKKRASSRLSKCQTNADQLKNKESALAEPVSPEKKASDLRVKRAVGVYLNSVKTGDPKPANSRDTSAQVLAPKASQGSKENHISSRRTRNESNSTVSPPDRKTGLTSSSPGLASIQLKFNSNFNIAPSKEQLEADPKNLRGSGRESTRHFFLPNLKNLNETSGSIRNLNSSLKVKAHHLESGEDFNRTSTDFKRVQFKANRRINQTLNTELQKQLKDALMQQQRRETRQVFDIMEQKRALNSFAQEDCVNKCLHTLNIFESQMLWKKKRPSASQKLKSKQTAPTSPTDLEIHHRFNSNPRPLRNLQISTNYTQDMRRGSNQLASNSSEGGSVGNAKGSSKKSKGSAEKTIDLTLLNHDLAPFSKSNQMPMRSTHSTNMKETTNADSSMGPNTTTGFYKTGQQTKKDSKTQLEGRISSKAMMNLRGQENHSITSVGRAGRNQFVNIEDQYFSQISNKIDPANQTGNFQSLKSNRVSPIAPDVASSSLRQGPHLFPEVDQDILERDKFTMTSTTFGAMKPEQRAFLKSDPSTGTEDLSEKQKTLRNTFNLYMNLAEQSVNMDNFQSKFAKRKEEIRKYQEITNKFYSTTQMIKDKTAVNQSDRKLMDAIRFQMRQEKAEELHKQKIVLEKNIFERRFPGPQTVRNTIKMRVSPRFKSKAQAKCKKFSITANSNTSVFKIQEEQSEGKGYLTHLNSQRNLPSKPSVKHVHFDDLTTRVLSFDRQHNEVAARRRSLFLKQSQSSQVNHLEAPTSLPNNTAESRNGLQTGVGSILMQELSSERNHFVKAEHTMQSISKTNKLEESVRTDSPVFRRKLNQNSSASLQGLTFGESRPRDSREVSAMKQKEISERSSQINTPIQLKQHSFSVEKSSDSAGRPTEKKVVRSKF